RVLALGPDGSPAGHPWAVPTPRDRSAGEIAWSPDGARLALTIEVDPPRFLVGPRPAGDDAPTARRITRIDWQWDEEGTIDRWSHLHVVDVGRGAKPRQVTAGDWGVSKIAWSPDGRTVAFTSDQRPDADTEPIGSIWSVDVDAEGAMPRQVLAGGGPIDKAALSPKGPWVGAGGLLAGGAGGGPNPGVVLGPPAGPAPPPAPPPRRRCTVASR